MEQQLKKKIEGVEQAIAVFQSISQRTSSYENSVDCVAKSLSDAWSAVAACKSAVHEAGSSARSTGWYVDQELWGAVHSGDWHQVADLAEELEERLEQASQSIAAVEAIVDEVDDTQTDIHMLASCVVADVKDDISFDGLVQAMQKLSFLN